MELSSMKNLNSYPIPFNQASTTPSLTASRFSSSIRFQQAPYRPRSFSLPVLTRSVVSRRGLGVGFRSLDRRCSFGRTVVAFAASHEESQHSDIEVEKEKDDHSLGTKEEEEEWKQALSSFEEQALKLQSVSQEAYEVYSDKAIVILKETSEKLRIQAEKARDDLSVITKEISEEGREYISTAAENSPEPVKEIVETFSSTTDDLTDVSKARDFHVGIPYGLLLSVGGFLSFMITGSVSAIRFGVILGGILLAFSISSLKSFKKGETFPLALKGQTAIAAILFLREIRLLSQRATVSSFLTTTVSGAVVVFYLYKIIADRQKRKGPDFEPKTEN